MEINLDPVYIEDYPDGYPLTYPETVNQYGNQASVEWDIRTRTDQIGKVRQLGQCKSSFALGRKRYNIRDFGVVIKWVLYPIVSTMAMGKEKRLISFVIAFIV